MIPIKDQWCIQIDITNNCFHGCLYCSRYFRHLRKDQKYYMSIEKFEETLKSLKGWKKVIGIIGGEPTLHPQFKEICTLIKKYFPNQVGLWTSGSKYYKEYESIIKETFRFIAFNPHEESQKNVCRHQPLTVAIEEAIENKEVRDTLIDDCWVQRTWCATTNNYGSYFCEIAAAIDLLLYDGKSAWKTTEGWYNKTPKDYEDQKHLCNKCGAAIPMERDLIKNKKQKFSPKLLQEFKDKSLLKVDNDWVDIFDKKFTINEIKENIEKWYPGNYREDLKKDQNSSEGKGFTKEFNF